MGLFSRDKKEVIKNIKSTTFNMEIKMPVKTTIVADNDKVTIERSGIASSIVETKGTTTILYKNITRIKIQPKMIGSLGFIEFISAGSNESTDPSMVRSMPNVVEVANPEQFQKLHELEKFITNRLSADKKTDTSSIADELKKLSELKNSGILTDEEFNLQKEKLLK